MSRLVPTALVILHGLVAVALLGAITHQALASWAPASIRPTSFFGRFRTVPPTAFAGAVVVLYLATATLGAVVYLYFCIGIRPALERSSHWQTLGLFDLKEHFGAIGLAILPAYWVCWRWPSAGESPRKRVALTSLLAFIVWWSFLMGHFTNNLMGFGS
ncbi:MAG: hypothetical protein ACLPJH_07290 [Myxococcaceae bacterium]